MAKKRLTPVARKLRRDMTDAEHRLWSHLRGNQFDGARFTRQFPIGDSVTDFACRSAKLVVELDGGQHTVSVEADAARTRMIEAHGYSVIRFWNNDVATNMDAVLETIFQHLRIARNRQALPPLKALSLEREGWVGVLGARNYPQPPSPLTPTLSPLGRGSIGRVEDMDRYDVAAAEHQCFLAWKASMRPSIVSLPSALWALITFTPALMIGPPTGSKDHPSNRISE